MAQETKARPGLISTHAPLAGRDCLRQRRTLVLVLISTHAPLAGRDPHLLDSTFSWSYFNPRAPCGARLLCKLLLRLHLHFTPRAPCGARPRDMQLLQAGIIFQPTRPLRGATVEGVSERTYTDISTHAPLAGRDRSSPLSIATRRAGFQPTRPLRGATALIQPCSGVWNISTHAPLAGRDRLDLG